VDIAEALAHIEIHHVLSLYARGVDRADLETLSSVYHPEGTDEHGTFNGLGSAFARQLIDDEKDMTAVGQHHITNVVIQMDGASDARVESYFLAFHPHEETGSLKLGIAAGRYIDHFQRRDGAWKILRRRVIMDWTRDNVEGPAWGRTVGAFPQGRRKGQNDESYAFFEPGKGD
jgi:hypothetical protein